MIPFEDWFARNQQEARRLARDPDVKPLYVRVMFAAEGWANLIGHAEFAVGGLALILQSSNPRTGEIHIPSRQQVSNEIKRAIDMGLIDETSSIRCLVPNRELFSKSGGHGGKACRHHGIRAPKRTQSVTPEVSVDVQNDTPEVSPRHPRGVALSEERPISDLFCTGAAAPDPTQHREAS